MTHATPRELGRERLTFGAGWPTVPRSGHRSHAAPLEEFESQTPALPKAAQDWGVLGLFGFTAVLLLRPQDQVPLLTPLHLAEVFAAAGILPMLMHRLTRGLPIIPMTPEVMGLLVFGATILATAPFSIWPGGVVQAFLDTFVKVMVVFVLMMNTITTRKRFEQFSWLILLCCGYVAVLALVNYARGINIVERERLDGPVRGLMGNPNDLAMNLVTFMPLAVTIAMSYQHATLKRLSAAAITAAMFAVIILTKSRSGALGLIVMVVTLVLLGRKVRRGFGTITLAVTLAAVPLLPSSFWMRMSTIVNPAQDRALYTGSREARSNVMREGIQAFLTHPITGVGAGQFKNYNPPERQERWLETHNAFIQVAAELGIVGLLAFSFLVYRAGYLGVRNLKQLAPIRRRRPGRHNANAATDSADRRMLYGYAVGLMAGFAGWLVCSIFASIAYGWTFYYLLALICTLHALLPPVARGRRHVQTTRAA
ncbi:MAG TPA: O-antigen ligase family protein [Vicinamibacterales bacterium]|jgi:O-antigen ligase|nr:O-antigen ligase family protein [Vicinamibacterales bacterium]